MNSGLNIKRSNPFNGAGIPVTGERLVGRWELLDCLHRAITDPATARSVELRGIIRIGKTSLVAEVLSRDFEALRTFRRLPVQLNMGQYIYEGTGAFLRAVVREVLVELEAVDGVSGVVRQHADLVHATGSALTTDFSNFFQAVRRTGWHIILVIDEFDLAPFVFVTASGERSSNGFQALRDLPNSNMKYRVTLFLITRTPVKHIEEIIVGNSNLHNLLDVQVVRLFTDDEADSLLSHLGEVGISLGPVERSQIKSICGNHPYLLSRLACKIVDKYLFQGSFDLDTIFGWEGLSVPFNHYYDDLWRWLTGIKLNQKLLEILFGPRESATRADAATLLSYGLLRVDRPGDPNDPYRAFSDHWADDLWIRERNAPFFSLWTDTERAVRRLIDRAMTREFGTEEWYDLFSGKYPQRGAELWPKARIKRDSNRRQFSAHAADSLVEYLEWSKRN